MNYFDSVMKLFEKVSGIGLILLAVVMTACNVTEQELFSEVFSPIWGLILFVLGMTQLMYDKLNHRLMTNFISSAVWCHVAFSAYLVGGDLTLVSLVSIPYSLASFYNFGFLLGES